MGKMSSFFHSFISWSEMAESGAPFGSNLVFFERRSAPGGVAFGRERSSTSALRDGLTVLSRSGCLQMSWRIENKSYLVNNGWKVCWEWWIHPVSGVHGWNGCQSGGVEIVSRVISLTETNSKFAHENRPKSKRKFHLPTIDFQGQC